MDLLTEGALDNSPIYIREHCRKSVDKNNPQCAAVIIK